MADRRCWTPAAIADIRKALAFSTTASIAKQYNTSARTLRSALKRHGISVRYARRVNRPHRATEGLKVCRSVSGVAATYGAEALANLPDHACRWPLGDPAEPGFSFCGAHVGDFGPYCAAHRQKAYVAAPPWSY